MDGPPRVTLPDLMRGGLDVVFIGINPSVYSVEQGHYFARRTNRFWPAFSRSRLSQRARDALGLSRLGPAHDSILLDHGFGFTDCVKRATARADELTQEEFHLGCTDLLARLESCQPRIACFQGLTGFRPFLRILAPGAGKPEQGQQPQRIGRTRLFVIPNPSPANAHETVQSQTAWYDYLAAAL